MNRSHVEVTGEDLCRDLHTRSDEDSTIIGVQLVAPPNREPTFVLTDEMEET